MKPGKSIQKLSGKAVPALFAVLMIAGLAWLFVTIGNLWQEHKLRSENSEWEYVWGERGQQTPPETADWTKASIDDTPPGRDGREYLWFRGRLPDQLPADPHLYLPGAYQLVEVFFEDRKVLASETIDNEKPEIGGRSPFFVQIGEQDRGAVVHLKIYSRLSKIGIIGIPEVGSRGDLIEQIIRKDLPRTAMSFIVMFAGVALLLTTTNAANKWAMLQNCLFLVTLGLHSLTRTRLIHIFFEDAGLLAAVNLLTLYSLPVSLGFYLTALFRDGYTWVIRTMSWFHLIVLFCVLCAWAFLGHNFEDYHDILGTVIATTVSIGVVIFILRMRSYEAEGLIFLMSVPAAAITGVHDALVATGVIAWAEPLVIFGSLPSLLAMYFLNGKTWDQLDKTPPPKVATIDFSRTRIAGTFEPSIEKQYRRFNFIESMPALRASIHLTTIFALITLSLLMGWASDLVVHMGVITTMVLLVICFNNATLAVMKQESGWKYTEGLILIVQGLFHLSFIYLMSVQEPNLAKPLFGLLMIVLFATYATGVGSRWHLMAPQMAVISVIWGIVIYRIGAHPTYTGEPRLMIFCLVSVNMFGILTAYSRENQTRRRFVLTLTVEAEQHANEKLLASILPDHVATRLKSNNTIADFHATTSILFADLCGFTDFSAKHPPQSLVHMLDWLVCEFDSEASRLGIEKIKIIGDCYMAVAGLTDDNSGQVDKVVRLGMAMNDVLLRFNRKFGTDLKLRVGIHSGSLTAGIIGKSKFSYDVWGDAVNVAARMEQTCEPGHIQLTKDAMDLLEGDFPFTGPVEKEIKGKGKVLTWSMPVETTSEQSSTTGFRRVVGQS